MVVGKRVMKTIRFIATWGYVGLSPKAPGTIGTLATLPLAYLLMAWGAYPHMVVTFLLTIFAIFICVSYENFYQTHDSKEIVIDEVVGFLITMAWLPLTWQSFVLGFIFFRFFDILKPFPIGWLDKNLKGGFGVVADDIAAGIISNILLQWIYNQTAWLGESLVL
ncbi:MAG: phosphatidylglycerophosphatase A [Bdellovibrionaceae bacterium]|nr:phosphatidylglycerophosphatase A [Pseudobdellovibrionaceae bacterium]